MDRFVAMRVFVRVADRGSFSRVAEEMELSSSYVSKLVQQLEDSLGAKLLQRSTRRLQLTDAGAAYLAQCRRILDLSEQADASVGDWGKQPKGRLRINLPLAFATAQLGPVMSAFARRYPELELDLHLSDQQVDLLEGGFDCGLRLTTQFRDSSYIATSLGSYRIVVCASPAYLAVHGAPALPADLPRHRCFVYAYASGANRWPLVTEDAPYVPVEGAMRVNSTPFMKEFILDGLGIGVLPEFVAQPELAQGRLVEVLADVARPELKLYAVYPERSFVPAKVRVWVDFMKEALRERGSRRY